MPPHKQTIGAAKTLVKALRLVEVISQRPEGLTLAEASRVSGLPKPTAHRVLGPLVQARILRIDGAGVYRLGMQCLVLGTAFLESLDLREEARDVLAELVERTGETCHLGVLDGARIVYIEKVESSHAVRMFSKVGLTNPVHSTGLGKAMAAFSDERVIEEVIAAGLPRRTPRTTTDPEAFRAELESIRRRGYAVDNVENEDGIRCVAAPVRDHTGTVVAGISVAGPQYRLTLDRVSELVTVTLFAAASKPTVFPHSSRAVIVFVPVDVDGEPVAFEHTRIEWGTPAEIARLPLAPSDRHFVEFLTAGDYRPRE
jgi:DNA-binding IclR family transcriptional regulator